MSPKCKFSADHTLDQECWIGFSVILCYTLLYSVILCYTLLYSVILCYTLLYSVILCYTLLYSVILCYTLLHSVSLCYETVADVPESWVWWRVNFQSGSRVLKKVFWTFSYLCLSYIMRFQAKKLLKTIRFWKSLNSSYKSGSWPQKSPKIAQKMNPSIAIYSIFWKGMSWCMVI